jgi:hypothetical protein
MSLNSSISFLTNINSMKNKAVEKKLLNADRKEIGLETERVDKDVIGEPQRYSPITYLMIISTIILCITIILPIINDRFELVIQRLLPNESMNYIPERNIPDLEMYKGRRIVAVGDLHGDYQNTIKT